MLDIVEASDNALAAVPVDVPFARRRQNMQPDQGADARAGEQLGLLGERYRGGMAGSQQSLPFTQPSQAEQDTERRLDETRHEDDPDQTMLFARRRAQEQDAFREQLDGLLTVSPSTAGSSWVDYGVIEASERERLRVATGQDYAGYTHMIDASAIRKVLRDHGGDALPLTMDDLASLPTIVTTADAVEAGRDSRRGLPTIRYTKRINGHVVVVEEVRTGRKKLALLTMYKKPTRGGGELPKTSPGRASDHSIDQPGAEGKQNPENFARRRRFDPETSKKLDQRGRKLVTRIAGDAQGRKIGIGSIVDYLADAASAEMRYGLPQMTERTFASSFA